MFPVAFWLGRRRPLCCISFFVVAVCHASASQGLSRSEVISIAWDPRPREPVEGVLRATSVLELAAHAMAPVSRSSCCYGCVLHVCIAGVKATCQVSRSPEAPARATRGLAHVSLSEVLSELLRRRRVWDAEGFGVLSRRRPDSPLSHCLSLRWFRSHVVVSGVRPQLGQAALLRVLCVSVAALSHPCAGTEAGARLASRACGLWVPLLAASGGGLVVVVVTAFSSRCFRVFLVARAAWRI
ncbi:hypothetical protein Taro_052455 [Colocasia esculenta]|uniref:Uncharacterized protein n=1 Tax=Colocasia esculenta TaxID=4460 RepID=A0A843XJY3_COLES|nr:hypothetical protein [Colocasia esculenta]